MPNQKSKTIDLKEEIEEKNVDLITSIDQSSPVIFPNSSEKLMLHNNLNTAINFSEIQEDTSQNYDDNQNSFKQVRSITIDTSVPETNHQGTSALSKESKKKDKHKVGFLQMRIDSTIYFDNMGYSYQIQNEKNDKK